MRKPAISNLVFGMLLFVFVEVMFFVALLSAFVVVRASSGVWVPPGDVRLPVLTTAINTGILFLSGILLLGAGRGDVVRRHLVLAAILCGTFFVTFQGFEWVQLIRFGMTMYSGIFSACFFLLVGAHAMHAWAGVLAMVWFYRSERIEELRALQIFWLFVVGIWPVLYGLVYF